MKDKVILSGWKAIATACDFKTRKTIRKKAKKYGMPIIYMGRTPTISRKALEEWWEDLKNKRNKHYKIVLLLLY
jgi:hypothetical protein